MSFRDLRDVARAVARPDGVIRLVAGGVYLMNAATDDGIVHLANLHLGSGDDLSLIFPCRGLLVDGHGGALAHLRGNDEDVSCMACVARFAS